MFGIVPFNKKTGVSKRGDFWDLRDVLNEFWDFNYSLLDGRATFKADVKETEKEYIVEADLPGIDKKAINMDLRDDKLTIEVNKEETKEEQNEGYIMKERTRGMLCRSFYINNVDNEKVSAKYENGVLTVTLPKAEPEKGKQKSIEIH